MNLVRRAVEIGYELFKPALFHATRRDPQVAHELFVTAAQQLHAVGLERLVLDNPTNDPRLMFELSNAAGFNKNGEIPPTVLHYLGFDRVVVGTVTADPWPGNPRPTITRYPATHSMINWMGLPGDGAEEIAARLDSYEKHGVPLTINLMPTPQKSGDEALHDLARTINMTKLVHLVDRYELNVSCPNTHTPDIQRTKTIERIKVIRN